MPEERSVTDFQRSLAAEILELLRRAGSEGMTGKEMMERSGAKLPSWRRAMKWLRDDEDAPIEFDRSTNRWRLEDPSFTLPLHAPDDQDFAALVVGGATLASVADTDLAERITRLVEELDGRARQQGEAPDVRPDRVVATATTATPVSPRILLTLLKACNGKVVRIAYDSVWSADPPRTYEIEPWQIRLHDGVPYLLAYSHAHEQPRIFRVAHVLSAVVVDGVAPRGARPPHDRLWGERDPACGVDYDRPGEATIRVRGPMARMLARTRMHPGQEDRWIEENELLERHVRYRSCREFARRLLPLGDALVAVSPPELADEIRKHARALVDVETLPEPEPEPDAEG